MHVPREIDGALVLRWANVRGRAPTGATRHVVRGQEVSEFAGLAITRYEDADGVYLFYCDVVWKVVSDTYHDSVDLAVEQAVREFGRLDFRHAIGSDVA